MNCEREGQSFALGFLDSLLLLCFCLRSDLELYLVASSKLVLNVGCWPEALELTFDHDAHFGTKSLGLFHGVSGDDNATLLPLRRNLGYNVPHESLSLWVNSSRRFIKEDQRRVTEHCHRN